MNIGVNARFLFSERLEGVHRYIYETTYRMAVRHPEHSFILFYDRKYSEALVFPENVRRIIIPLPARHPVLWFVWFEILLPVYLRLYKIDVFYSGDGFMSLFTSIPTVMVSHDLAYIHYPRHIPVFHLWYARYFYPKYHQKASHIIAVSESTKEDIIRNYGIDPVKISVGYNAVSEKFKIFTEAEKKKIREKYTEGRPYFLYMGAIHPRKNIIELIAAFRTFSKKSKSDYCLVLAGRIAWHYRDVQRSISNDPNIVHTGFVNHEVKSELLSAAEALVYVSLFEGFGIPLIEAMSAGVPVITSDVSSMPEVAGDAALLADPNRSDSIAEAMMRITGDADLRKSLIIAGLSRYKFFNWDNTADVIYEKLRSVSLKSFL